MQLSECVEFSPSVVYPGEQAVQFTAPSALYVPLGQGTHLPQAISSLDKYVPAGHTEKEIFFDAVVLVFK